VVGADIRNVKRRGSWQLGGAAVGLARCDGYSPRAPAAHSPRTTANTSTNFSGTEPGLRQAERRRAYTHAFGPSHPGHGSARNDRKGAPQFRWRGSAGGRWSPARSRGSRLPPRSSHRRPRRCRADPRFLAGERIPDTASRRSGAMRPMHSIRQRVSSPITWSIEPRTRRSGSANASSKLGSNPRWERRQILRRRPGRDDQRPVQNLRASSRR
jgi:hypothetical protein